MHFVCSWSASVDASSPARSAAGPGGLPRARTNHEHHRERPEPLWRGRRRVFAPPSSMTAPAHRGDAHDRILRARLPAPQRLILMGYLSHFPSSASPAEGTAWPSIDLLCCYAGTGTKATGRHRAALIEAGLLVVVRTRSANVPECRIDFGALEALGASERGASVDPGSRASHFGHDGGSAMTADPPSRRNRFGHGDGTGSVVMTHEPSPRTLPKNPPQLESTSDKSKTDPDPLSGLAWTRTAPKRIDRRQLAQVCLRIAADISGRPCKALGIDGTGRDIDPRSAKTTTAPILALLRAKNWPDLDEFQSDALLMADAARRCPHRKFARNLRAVGWEDGEDKSRSVFTLMVQSKWDDRLQEALRWDQHGRPETLAHVHGGGGRSHQRAPTAMDWDTLDLSHLEHGARHGQ